MINHKNKHRKHKKIQTSPKQSKTHGLPQPGAELSHQHANQGNALGRLLLFRFGFVTGEIKGWPGLVLLANFLGFSGGVTWNENNMDKKNSGKKHLITLFSAFQAS